MANQKFYELPGKRQEDDDFGEQTDWRPAVSAQSERLGHSSDSANRTLDNIDDALNDNSSGQPGASSPVSPGDLDRQEQQTSPAGNSTEDDDQESEQLFDKGNLGKHQQKGTGFWNKKRAGIAGGLAGGLLGGGIMGLSLLSGPFEFVHIAQLLGDSHFSSQEDAGDGRLGHMYRYLKTGDFGETRLSYLGSKYHNTIIGKLADAGIKLDYSGGSIYKGMTITPEKNSQFRDMSPEEFEQRTGTKIHVEKGKWVVDDIKGFWKQRKSLHLALNSLGDSKISTVVRMRNLAKFGLISWHPLSIIDRQVYKGASAINDHLKKKWNSRISAGQELVTVRAATTDKDGNPIKNPVSPDVIDESNQAIKGGGLKDAVGKIRNGVAGKTAVSALGAPSAALAVVCALKSIDDNVKAIRYAQIILPLIRLGMNFISVGNQIMTGQDTDPEELNYLAKSFNEIDSKGNTLSTWDQAKSIRANNGQPGGIDAVKDSGERDMITHAHIAALAWTQDYGIPQACSTVGQIVVGGVSIVLTIATLGTTDLLANLATGLVDGVVIGGFTEVAVNLFSNILAGDGIVAARGALWGSQADYGAALGANVTGIWSGGTALQPAQVAELNAISNANEQQDFQSQSLATRLFNPYDRNSLISRALIDNQNPSVTQNFANITQGFMNIGSSLLKLPSALFASAKAAPTTPYDYGFPVYGFSAEDLDNPMVDDPFANADAVANLLEGNTGRQYIDEAAKCFAVNIVKQPEASEGGKLLWNVLPIDQTNPENFDPYNSDSYPQDCAHPAGLNADDWLKLRFFILDTGTMEGYACAELDDSQSCINDGMDDTGGTAFNNEAANTTRPSSSSRPNTAPKPKLANYLLAAVPAKPSFSALFGTPSTDVRNRTIGAIS